MIDPWASTSVDYDKLVNQFGIQKISDMISEIKDPQRLMKRGVVFGHREFDEINKGKAYVYTQIDNNIEEYEIEIINTNKDLIKTNKSISFKITDKRLLEKTGGIIRGMSGSPIVQDNKVIGAVTHVVVDNVEKGYAVYIKTMLEEGERD